MRSIGITLACAALALAAGCDNRALPSMDSGINFMDSGTGRDSGPRVDSGPRDGGAATCSVTLGTTWPALPAACLPRCSTTTLQCIGVCVRADAGMGVDAGSSGEECIQTCIDNDGTPDGMLTVNGTADVLDCAGCLDWQATSCILASCNAQALACANCGTDRCNDTTPGCEAEEAAYLQCQTSNMAAIQSCYTTRAGMCFG